VDSGALENGAAEADPEAESRPPRECVRTRCSRVVLGMSPRKARALLRLERAGRRCPELVVAYREGRLSRVQARYELGRDFTPLLSRSAAGCALLPRSAVLHAATAGAARAGRRSVCASSWVCSPVTRRWSHFAWET
jgi:hypothetical protein